MIRDPAWDPRQEERKKENHEGCFQGTLYVQGTTKNQVLASAGIPVLMYISAFHTSLSHPTWPKEHRHLVYNQYIPFCLLNQGALDVRCHVVSDPCFLGIPGCHNIYCPIYASFNYHNCVYKGHELALNNPQFSFSIPYRLLSLLMRWNWNFCILFLTEGQMLICKARNVLPK